MRIAAVILTLLATPLAAQDLIVQFADADPKNRISFQSAGCNIANAVVLIDLAGSKGGLTFDAPPGGARANQPVEITHGYGALSPVRNGDQRLQVLVRTLNAGDTFDLTADLADGRGGEPEIKVSGAELAGASIRLALSDRVLSGVFDSAGTATIPLPRDATICLAAAD